MYFRSHAGKNWIPAFAGMTADGFDACRSYRQKHQKLANRIVPAAPESLFYMIK